MNATPVTSGCGGTGACQCGSRAAAPVAAINGIALHAPGETLAPEELRERAWSELLRQHAVAQGLLPRLPALSAPLLTPAEHGTIATMLEQEVPLRTPDEAECRRYYDAHKARYVQGRKVHLRHILFAVTDGIDVHRLAIRAEQALLDLLRKDASPGRFAELARELSNCPSGAQGGDLGWIGPEDCAEELANELFDQREPLRGMGVHPRLVHSRYGLHIAEVLGRRQGRQAPFEEVRGRIASELAQQARATALHQYIRVLAGEALVEGVDLEGTSSPLVQ
jgi:peptidyl-prolyl cis-trans isomerase C